MKTGQQIRRYRDDLRAALRLPCACQGARHGKDCCFSNGVMRALADALDWVLDEGCSHDRTVEFVADQVARSRVGG